MPETRYSIKDLENFTSIKAHTIRIWEQRYGLLEPKRTDTNIRYYGESDLKKILNINLLYTNGLKISKIAALSDTEIIERAKAIILNEEGQSEIDEITMAILNFKSTTVKAILNREMDQKGMIKLYQKIILPLLEKIGELWQVNSIEVIHEHFFSNLFREFLIVKTYDLEDAIDLSKKAILFLPDHEEHEFGLLLSHYLLKQKGYHCYYFGQRVPMNDVEDIFEVVDPQLVVTSFVDRITEKHFERYMNRLKKLASTSKVIISGGQVERHAALIPKNIKPITSVSDLVDNT